MKIFEVEHAGGGETDWVLVNSIEQVIPFLKVEHEDNAEDGAYENAKITEIPESEWSEHWVALMEETLDAEQDSTITFKEFVEREKAKPDFTLPAYIAGTMFQ